MSRVFPILRAIDAKASPPPPPPPRGAPTAAAGPCRRRGRRGPPAAEQEVYMWAAGAGSVTTLVLALLWIKAHWVEMWR